MTAAALWERGRRRFPCEIPASAPHAVRGPLPRHERRPLRLPAALLTAKDAGDLGIGLAIQCRREDAYSDGPSIGWSAGPRFSNRAFSFSTEFASKLYRGASALATGSMCISHPTRGTPARGPVWITFAGSARPAW